MVKLLIVLVLLTDPALQPTADALARRLQDSTPAGAKLQVVVGKDAVAALAKRGVADGDLTAGPGVGIALTARERDLAVVRIERLDRGGDGVIESRVWLAGRQESTVAIVGGKEGKAGDPAEGAARSVADIVAPWLGEASAPAAPPLARLAERSDWQALAAAAAKVDKPDARTLYYLVLAQHRLAHTEEAAATLARLKQQFPTSIHTGAAETMLAPAANPAQGPDINEPPAADDGGNVLR
jgi:hypothetical protein